MIAATQPRPARRRAPIIMVVIIAVALVVTAGVLVVLKPWADAAPLTLTNGKTHVSYGMSRAQIEQQVGQPTGPQSIGMIPYDGVRVFYRGDVAVMFRVDAGSQFSVSGISAGTSISDAQKKFPTLADEPPTFHDLYFTLEDGKYQTRTRLEAVSAPYPGSPRASGSLTKQDYFLLSLATDSGSDTVSMIMVGDYLAFMGA